jgi:hypothetical protein
MDISNHNHTITILQALAYYDVFNFPLNFEEILRYSQFSKQEDLSIQLEELIDKKIIFKLDEFYSLRNDKLLAIQRKADDQRAKEYENEAYKKSILIGKFPYVKGVFISGSLSKGTMGEDGDIDYFIVTTPNRLWVARTLLILYKKIFLLNSRKYFCINYLIDEEALEIEQKNRFTATELITLLPMINTKLYANLLKNNAWVNEFYTQPTDKLFEAKDIEKSVFQKLTEPILNTKFGDIMDDFFMSITLKRWKSKFHGMNSEDFNIALTTTKRVSKHHPSHFQKRVLNGYNERMHKLEGLISNSNNLHQTEA